MSGSDDMAAAAQKDTRAFWDGRLGRGLFVAIAGLIGTFTLAILTTFLYFQKFSIPASSMNPTLHVGDLILASRIGYDSELERGDVALFWTGSDETRAIFIKRVIGLPGDRVALRRGQLIINGAPVARRKIEDGVVDDGAGFRSAPQFEETLPDGRTIRVVEAEDDSSFDSMREVTVPDRHYFVLGDHRDNSYDSRAMDRIGFIRREDFVGKAKWIYFSMGRDGVRFGRIGQRVQ